MASVMAGLLLASPALAQKSHEDVATVEARARFNEGIKFADDGNHEAARLKFSQAWLLLKSPAVLFNLARSEQLSGHPVEALEHYRIFSKLAATDPKIPEPQKQRATENIAELSKKVGQVDVDAPPAAQIAIDGKAVEWTGPGDPIPVLPGKHEVSASHEGRTASVTVEATPGTVAKARLSEPLKTPATPPPAAPIKPIEPPREEPSSSWTTGRVAGLAIAGGGLAAIGVGVVFHLQSSSAGSDADKLVEGLGSTSSCAPNANPLPADCARIQDKRDDQDSAANLRTAFWIGGGAMLVGGAALFLLSGKKSDDKPGAWRVLPTLSPKNASLSVIGTF